MTLTDKQIDELLATMKLPKLVRIKKPEPPPKPVLATDRKLSVEGQRERVAREVKELREAERKRAEERDAALERNRKKRERDRETGLYYRGLYEAVTTAEYWAKVNGPKVDHGRYNPIELFERQQRNENG